MSINHKFLFEISWEVCNKVGGIYTVIKSKLTNVINEFDNNYCLIGPLFDQNAEFVNDESVWKDIDLDKLKENLNKNKIIYKIGKWDIKGSPKVILIKNNNNIDQPKLLYTLWEEYGVDSITGGWDYIEPLLFSTLAGVVIKIFSECNENKKIIIQSHEWMSGAAILYLKNEVPDIASIFTTHATMLGRSMASNGIDIYKDLISINSINEANRFKIMAKHSMEMVCARESDVFTTVSEVTGIEAKHLLNVEPDIITTNGFNAKEIKDYTSNHNRYSSNRNKLLNFANKFLQKKFESDKTIIFSTSGRFEMHNKGIDLILDVLEELNKENTLNKQIIFYFFIISFNVDIARMVKRDTENEEAIKYSNISTHPVKNQYYDPLITGCERKGLTNSPDSKINIIYIPAYLNGNDGVLNLEYYDALSGCDFTIYPSYYEPWGYTPHESAAFSVPTISSDVAGFGKWILSSKFDDQSVKIIKRFGAEYSQVISELKNYINEYVNLNKNEHEELRKRARAISLKADWSLFFHNYIKAYDLALREAKKRIESKHKIKKDHMKYLQFSGTNSLRPRLREFNIKTAFPKSLNQLQDIAGNGLWIWDYDIQDLFKMIDKDKYYKLNKNPKALLASLNEKEIKNLAQNKNFINKYEIINKKYRKYLSEKKSLVKLSSFISEENPVAYFSMEFGLHESMPLYSGGLGILSGDHIKTASDLNLPLFGVGLLYKTGYFHQQINKNGDQQTEYINNDFFNMPIQEMQNDSGECLLVKVEFPGRIVSARIWVAKIGRSSIYFLDTDIPENSVSDRTITSKLYGGGKKMRLEQEIILGIGGIQLIEDVLNISPSVYHINEGHSAFLIIERIIRIVNNKKIAFEEAKNIIKLNTVFTTHTPVAAGNENFDHNLIDVYLKNYIEKNNLPYKDIIEMGHINLNNSGPFQMTALALKKSFLRNGVSKLHGQVSREMWHELWDGFLVSEVPIFHITNGIHVASWLAKNIYELISKYASIDINTDLLDHKKAELINEIPDNKLWEAHNKLKLNLYKMIKETIINNWSREGEDTTIVQKFINNLNPDSLTISFARRFAQYKRPELFLKNIERLLKILSNEKNPVTFIFAGKAHPEDVAAQKIISNIVSLSKQDNFIGKIIFLESYDIGLAKHLLRGSDVWLNNPRRPLEASGTSGQKASVNGVINFSILDGWWDEAYNGHNGWAIGDIKKYPSPEIQDLADSNSLYEILETNIIPEYYNNRENGIPHVWLKKMKQSMISTLSVFNTHRMLNDYAQLMYNPAAEKFNKNKINNFEAITKFVNWQKKITGKFSSIHISNITIHGIHGDNINVGEEVSVSAEISKVKLDIQDIAAEFVLLPADNDIHNLPERIKMHREIRDGENAVFTCKYKVKNSGKFKYGIRVIPEQEEIENITDLNLVYWA